MGIRDFSDRDQPEPSVGYSDEDHRVEGHSPSADLLTSTYAHQLEQMGLIQEAAFVLLHIEGSSGFVAFLLDICLSFIFVCYL